MARVHALSKKLNEQRMEQLRHVDTKTQEGNEGGGGGGGAGWGGSVRFVHVAG